MTASPVMSITEELVAELEALASKATPGNWTTDGAACVVAKDSDQLNGGHGLAFCEGPDELKNAKYMAKASPLVIRALLAERAELIRDRERLNWLSEQGDDTQWMNILRIEMDDYETLRDAVDEIMRQEG